jgi:hypothetical protein
MKVCLNCGLLFELQAGQERKATLFCRDCKISEEFLHHLMRRIDGAESARN